MALSKQAEKGWKIFGVIAGIVVVSILIQWGRFESKVKDLKDGMGAVLPSNYFPFNGTYNKVSGKLMKA